MLRISEMKNVNDKSEWIVIFVYYIGGCVYLCEGL